MSGTRINPINGCGDRLAVRPRQLFGVEVPVRHVPGNPTLAESDAAIFPMTKERS